MNSRDRYRIVNLVHLQALLVALLLAGCQTATTIPPGAAVGAPKLVVGDHWQYRITDNLRRGAVTMLDVEVTSIAGGIATLRENFNGPDGRSEENEEIDANGWLVVGTLKNEAMRHFPSPVKLYDFPLEQGKTWRQVISDHQPGDRAAGADPRLRNGSGNASGHRPRRIVRMPSTSIASCNSTTISSSVRAPSVAIRSGTAPT